MAGNGKLATVFGGSGFVGRYIVWSLARKGYRVRAAVRRPDLAGYLQPMGVVGQVYPVQANVRYADSVARAVEGADIVINAVGILPRRARKRSRQFTLKAPTRIAKAAKEAGATRLVHISAIGRGQGVAFEVCAHEGHGEAATSAAFPSAIVLRPSIVFGPEDEFFNRFAAMAQYQPVSCLSSAEEDEVPARIRWRRGACGRRRGDREAGSPGTVYELGGPQVLTFRELLKATLDYFGSPAGPAPVPFWMAKLIALLTSPMPNALRPMTLDQVRLLRSDNVVSEAAEEGRPDHRCARVRNPSSIDAIVPAYLERFKAQAASTLITTRDVSTDAREPPGSRDRAS